MAPGRWAVLLLLLTAGEARAYRPFDETDADVTELHVLELEFGPLQLQRSAGFTSYVPTLIVNLGVFPGWEVVVDGLANVPVGSPRAPGSTGQLAVGLAVKGVVRRGSLQGGRDRAWPSSPSCCSRPLPGPRSSGWPLASSSRSAGPPSRCT
ncbi:MAG: hypothetical protein ACXWLA_10225 [Myxococcaceae bacterium]